MSFPDNPDGIHLQFSFGADLSTDPGAMSWTEIWHPDWTDGPIVIEHGFVNESSSGMSRMRFGLRNAGGRFSKRNVSGPYYGQLRDYTPVRVRLDLTGIGNDLAWGFGYVQGWPVDWSGPSIGERLQMDAVGALQRVIGDSTPHPVGGSVGEPAGTRFERLCLEAGVKSSWILGQDPLISNTEPMGAQPSAPLIDLLRECAAANEGYLLDFPFGTVGVESRENMYYEALADPTDKHLCLTLPYGATGPRRVISGLQVFDDQRDTVNVATVRGDFGADVTAEVVDGPKGSSFTTGVGPFPATYGRNLATSDSAKQHAAWLAHLGTVDKPRLYVSVDLISHRELIESWMYNRFVGQKVRITDPPPEHLGPDPLDMMLVGYRETIDPVTWLIELWLEPYDGYRVGVYGTDPAGRVSRYGGDQSTTSGSFVSGTGTSLTVATASGPLWSTTAAPFEIEVSGVRLKVTVATGASSPQTFTVAAAPTNGVIKTIPSGSPVRLAQPSYYGL